MDDAELNLFNNLYQIDTLKKQNSESTGYQRLNWTPRISTRGGIILKLQHQKNTSTSQIILHYHILHFFNLLLCQIWRLYSFSLIPESKHLKTLVDLDQLGIKLCFGLIRFFVSFNANGDRLWDSQVWQVEGVKNVFFFAKSII